MSFARLLRLLRQLLLLLPVIVAARADETAYLFTYFTGNGADGLHLAWSEDGYRWEALGAGASFLRPQVGKDRLMRDPSFARGPDGTYHLVWTSGWWDREIGHASTRDFVTWSEQQSIPVMAHEPAARNAWAPEVVWDGRRGRFLVFWASTIPGRFPETGGSSESGLNHRIYATSTADWREFEPTRLFCEPGFNVIDATLWVAPGGVVRMIGKDETLVPTRKNLRLAEAGDLEGPWVGFSLPFTRDWVEGPAVLTVGDATLVYFDVYREKHFGAVRTRDGVHWQDVSAAVELPRGARHGTMAPVPRSLIDALRAARPATGAVP